MILPTPLLVKRLTFIGDKLDRCRLGGKFYVRYLGLGGIKSGTLPLFPLLWATHRRRKERVNIEKRGRVVF